MNSSILILSIFFAVFLTVIPKTNAQEVTSQIEKTLGTKSTTALVRWFDELVDEYDNFVEKEKRKQFMRRLSRLNKSLYKLQRRKEEFIDELAVASTIYEPSDLDEEMYDSFTDLKQQYLRVRDLVDQISSTVSESTKEKGFIVSQLLSTASSERGKGMYLIAEEFRLNTLNAEKVKIAGEKGIEAVKAARAALSELIIELKDRG